MNGAVESLNLGLRFLLELAALGAIAYWAWTTQTGALRPALAVGLPLLAATLWATFRVVGDGGTPLIPVPGVARLALELALFGIAVWLLVRADESTAAGALAATVAVHYLVAYERVWWLLSGPAPA